MSGTLKSRRVLRSLETCPPPMIANTAGELLKAFEDRDAFRVLPSNLCYSCYQSSFNPN